MQLVTFVAEIFLLTCRGRHISTVPIVRVCIQVPLHVQSRHFPPLRYLSYMQLVIERLPGRNTRENETESTQLG